MFSYIHSLKRVHSLIRISVPSRISLVFSKKKKKFEEEDIINTHTHNEYTSSEAEKLACHSIVSVDPLEGVKRRLTC